MNQESQKLSVLEKVGYSLGDLAANLVFQTLVTYLAYFYTDIYGLKTEDATLVTLFVGLFAAFVFNPVMGAIADRTSTRWGKFRPWILWTAIPLGVTALLAFSTPDFSYSGKVIYAVITYSLLLLLYAANNLPYSALSGVITSDMGERNSMSAYRFIAVMFSQFFVQVFMYNLILKAGNGDKAVGIEKVMTILAIVGTLMLIVTFLTTKERVVPKAEQKSSLGEDLKDLSKNIPWIIMLTVTTLIFITLAMKGGAYVYYFENYVDKVQIAAILDPLKPFLPTFENDTALGLGVFNGGGILIGLIGIWWSKSLADKYGKKVVFMSSLFVSTLFIIAFYFFPPQAVGTMFLMQMLHMFFYGIGTPILWTMIADVADYSEWKNNRRATAIIFAAMMIGLKGGLSIGSALLTKILNVFDYQPGSSVGQTAETVNGIKLLVSVFPAMPFLIAVGLLFFYEINKKMEGQIQSDLEKRR
ncbi:MAG TPA: glycoside-pentoside-hexuronide (GPH):cation symporter [Leadbetterella sp.]|nr:glycoside-pentoside-hexuronide (GPH):cation symporter [Leadbetterella sp.]